MSKRSAMERRACVRPTPAGGWEVYELHAEEVIVYNGRVLRGLYPDEAFEIAAHLNVNRDAFTEERLTTESGTHGRRR